MKKFLSYLFLFLAAAFFFWQREILVSRVNFILQGPCDTPVSYRIGTVDRDYQMSRETFLAKIEQAAGIWNQVEGKNLFVYDPYARLTVNLIYTEKQLALDKLEQLQGDLSTGESSLKTMVAEYESLSRNFKARAAALNQEVALWNARGGAPLGVYERLIKEQKEMKAEADKLNALAEKLNLSMESYNLQVEEFNKNVEAFNVATLQKPEAGLYDGAAPKIDIYLTVNDEELIHTLAHELGHALALEHLDDPQAIMYPFTSEVIKPSVVETNALRLICEERNWERYLGFIRDKFQQGLRLFL